VRKGGVVDVYNKFSQVEGKRTSETFLEYVDEHLLPVKWISLVKRSKLRLLSYLLAQLVVREKAKSLAIHSPPDQRTNSVCACERKSEISHIMKASNSKLVPVLEFHFPTDNQMLAVNYQ